MGLISRHLLTFPTRSDHVEPRRKLSESTESDSTVIQQHVTQVHLVAHQVHHCTSQCGYQCVYALSLSPLTVLPYLPYSSLLTRCTTAPASRSTSRLPTNPGSSFTRACRERRRAHTEWHRTGRSEVGDTHEVEGAVKCSEV